LLKYFGLLKSRYDSSFRPTDRKALWDFLIALALLGIALFLALGSEAAARGGDRTLGFALALTALLLAGVTAVTLLPRIARRVNIGNWWIPFSFNITREGAVYILAVFLLSLAAINTGNNLLFLILAMLLSAILVSGVVARVSLRSVSVSMTVPENVFEGERVSIKVALRNRKKLLPAFSISVEGLGPGRASGLLARLKKFSFRRTRVLAHDSAGSSVLRHSAYFPMVLPGDIRSEIVYQAFPRRGRYRLEGYRISTRFPFGFFQRGERVRASGEILVYPSIHEVSSYFHLLPFLPGKLEGQHVGHGESLYAIRKYLDGESARIVDWKATAKTGELMARQYAREEESKFCLILDTRICPPAKPDYTTTVFERAVSLAASLAGHFCEEGAELEFLAPGEHIPRGMGTDHLYRILRSLAVIQCELDPDGATADLRTELSNILDAPQLREILSEKVFKVIITSKPRGSFSSSIWRSSHVIYFSEL
jgi:uncharacterized protein (DUF58 family)